MAGFGSEFSAKYIVAHFRNGVWETPRMLATEAMPIHPASHVLHYASECFEGLKAYRNAAGGQHIFRLDKHIARMRNSAEQLCLPVPETDFLEAMITTVVRENQSDIPEFPGSLYLRPTMIGLDENIGNAGSPTQSAVLYVLTSPVGDYFTAGSKGLRLLVDDQAMRTTPNFGQVKTGGNYAMALQHIKRAKAEYQCDQVLFCPGGDVQETGAANFFLIKDKTLITKPLDGSILPGVTRDSLLSLAESIGYKTEVRDFSVEELLSSCGEGECALSGTAAVLTPVAELVHNGKTYSVGNGSTEQTQNLRQVLLDVQSGVSEENSDWLVKL